MQGAERDRLCERQFTISPAFRDYQERTTRKRSGGVLVMPGGRRQLTQRPRRAWVVKARAAVCEDVRDVAGGHPAVL